jgi:thymidine phosphorylase
MAAKGKGVGTAREILDSGRALSKFEAICEAQGGMREPRRAAYSHAIPATQGGMVKGVDNRRLARLAKLAGAPKAASAGVVYHTPLGTRVEAGQPLITLYAETTGELSYAKDYAENQLDIVIVGDEE